MECNGQQATKPALCLSVHVHPGWDYCHSSTLKLPGREDFHSLSDFCNRLSALWTISMGCEPSWGTTFGVEGLDSRNPLTEGERNICGRTSAAVVESIIFGSKLWVWETSEVASGTLRKARVCLGVLSLRFELGVEGQSKRRGGSCIGAVNGWWRNYPTRR